MAAEKQPATDKLPPHNLEAERSVLGGILLKPSAFDEVRMLVDTDDFFLPGHREVFDAMATIVRRRRPIDVIAVADELRMAEQLQRLEGGEIYLLTLSNSVPTAENIGHYARLVKEKATLRRLIAACAEISSRAYGDFGDFQPFLDDAERQVTKITQQSRLSHDKPRKIGDVLEHVFEVMQSKTKDPTRFFVPTGLRGYDRRMKGYGRGHLVVVAADPGNGKSAWALNVAHRSAEEYQIPNLFFSCEMGLQEVVERDVGFVSMVETRRIHRGSLVPDDWSLIHQASKRIATIPLWIDDRPVGIEEIESTARQWAAEARASLPLAADGLPALVHITVDYLQILRRTSARGRNDEAILADITRGLKLLAKALQSPITLISQLNREHLKEKGADGKPRRPRLGDLKGSGAIEADADTIIIPHHDDPPSPAPRVWGQPDAPEEMRRRLRLDSRLIVPKNRSGGTGDIPCIFDKAVMGFFDVPPSVDDDDPRVPD